MQHNKEKRPNYICDNTTKLDEEDMHKTLTSNEVHHKLSNDATETTTTKAIL
jgi:hypothetical protein